jgi:hypothetical protein
MIITKGSVRGLAETSSAINQLPSLLQQMGQAAMRESLEHVGESVRSFLVGPYPTEIERRSGSFIASFRRGHAQNIWQVQAQGTQVIGTFGSNDQRAHILNDGGTIRPVRSQFLAVRTEFTKTGRGVVKEKYRQPLRNLPNTFVRPISAPKAVAAVFERIGKRVVPIAWLLKEVTIIGRKFMQKGEAKATPGIQSIFQARVDAVLTRFNETLQKAGLGGR